MADMLTESHEAQANPTAGEPVLNATACAVCVNGGQMLMCGLG